MISLFFSLSGRLDFRVLIIGFCTIWVRSSPVWRIDRGVPKCSAFLRFHVDVWPTRSAVRVTANFSRTDYSTSCETYVKRKKNPNIGRIPDRVLREILRRRVDPYIRYGLSAAGPTPKVFTTTLFTYVPPEFELWTTVKTVLASTETVR